MMVLKRNLKTIYLLGKINSTQTPNLPPMNILNKRDSSILLMEVIEDDIVGALKQMAFDKAPGQWVSIQFLKELLEYH